MMCAAEMNCPLCESPTTVAVFADKKRSYQLCECCGLVFVPDDFILDPDLEKAEYDKHENSPDDPAYRQFLNRCLEPVLQSMPKKAQGLDFGCGPGPTLSLMAAEQGYSIKNYDPFYAADSSLLKLKYNFITLTEVIEHVREPRTVLSLLDSMLCAGGVIAIMTKRRAEPERFHSWHYKNDPTHIRFYNVESFEWIARHYGWALTIVDTDVVIFTKSGENAAVEQNSIEQTI